MINIEGTIPKLIKKSFTVYREILKLKLYRSLLKIHFLINMWMLLNHQAFQAIVTHFIDKNMQELQKALLVLLKLPSHSSKDQAAAFLQVAKQYNILGRIGYICGDNYGLNNKIYCLISEGLKARGLLNWNSTHHRI